MTCTHECDQGDACTCADPLDECGLWIRIPDLVMLLIVACTVGVILGVTLVRAGMVV